MIASFGTLRRVYSTPRSASGFEDQSMPTPDQTLGSFAAICSQYLGNVANWLHILPSAESAQAAFNALPSDLQADLIKRAANHGLEGWEIMQKVPEVLWDRIEMFTKWLDLFDISHIKATSVAPELAGDQGNWTWELRGVNRGQHATEMTGARFREANDTARETAETMTGEAPFWDFHEFWQGCLEVAETAGMTAAWLPKEDWRSLMLFAQSIWVDMKGAKTFSAKVKAARLIAIRIKRGFMKASNHLAAAFLLAVLTLMWPPVQWFVAAWALAGLAGFVVSVLRVLTRKGMGYAPIAAIARTFDTALSGIFAIIRGVRNVLDLIKNGIFNLGCHCVDLIFGTIQVWMKVCQPVVKQFIEKTKNVVKPVIQAVTTVAKKVVKTIKSALSGFVGWLGSIFG